MALTKKVLTNNFSKVGDRYEAETDVNNVFNIHVENGGSVTLQQRTSGTVFGGTYAWNQEVVDDDINGVAFPKRIKLICEKLPTYCCVSVLSE